MSVCKGIATNSYYFYDQDPVSKTGIFRGPLIQTLINKIWFKNKEDDGVIHPEFSENDMLPMPTVAFVMTVVSLFFRNDKAFISINSGSPSDRK